MVNVRVKTTLSLFCSDYAFWGDKPCVNSIEGYEYVGVRNCDYIVQENHTVNLNYTVLEKDCNNTDLVFYCPQSRECIKEEWVCDGSVNCLYGEDESFDGFEGFEGCSKSFPEGATIKCIEADRPPNYNITIYAVPCDGIKECLNGEDEIHCKEDWKYTLGLLGIIFSFMFALFSCFFFIIKNKIHLHSSALFKEDPKLKRNRRTVCYEFLHSLNVDVNECSDLVGNNLAAFKVGTFINVSCTLMIKKSVSEAKILNKHLIVIF